MKFLGVLIILASLLAGAPAAWCQAVAGHQAAPAAAPATQAKPAASAIIPGSPLAALTGAAAPATPADIDADTPSPFGTSNFGLSVTSAFGDEAAGTVEDFFGAIRQSTRLTPVIAWARATASSPMRRGLAADIAAGLAIVFGPALAVEAALRFALRRPRAATAARAAMGPAARGPDSAPVGPADHAAPERPNTPHDTPPDDAPELPDPEITETIADADADADAGDTVAGRQAARRRRLSVFAWIRTFGFALLHFALALIPLIGFAVVVQILVSAGIITTRPAHLADNGIVNAYLLCRLILEALRFLASPDAASLRLLHLPDRHAIWLVRRVRLLLATGVAFYAVISICELLGLDHAGAAVLVRLIALILHIEVAVAVWESRHVVAGWIAGKRVKDRFLWGFRHRFAQIWHFFALFYILALWIALAAGIHHAFGLLLRIILVTIAAGVITRAAWIGSTNMLERLFPDPATARHPQFLARARAYNPFVRGVIRVVIGFLGIVLVLQGWGINAFGWLLTDKLSRALIDAFVSIIVTIGIALALWEVSNALLNGRIDRLTARGRTREASRLRTLLPMLKATIGVAIFLVAGLICLSKIGVNAAPLLAGAGVLGIAIGFGSQKLVQDIITGLFLLLEDAMQVGDVVSLAGMSGTVERLSIRTIRLRGDDGSVNIIPFSAVTTVTNKTRDFSYAQISIQVGYEEDLTHVYDVLRDIARKMREEQPWAAMIRDDLQIFGLDEFAASALVITGRIRTGPGQHWAIRRQFYARVKRRFADEGIDMPYTYLAPPPAPVTPPAVDATRLPTETDPPGH